MKSTSQSVDFGKVTRDQAGFPQNVNAFFPLVVYWDWSRTSYTELVPRGKRKAQPPEMANSVGTIRHRRKSMMKTPTEATETASLWSQFQTEVERKTGNGASVPEPGSVVRQTGVSETVAASIIPSEAERQTGGADPRNAAFAGRKTDRRRRPEKIRRLSGVERLHDNR